MESEGFADRFRKDETGSFTIEFVIWAPIFVIILAIMVNVSMVFFHQSQMLRVVQDANRAFAQNRIRNPHHVEAYIVSRLSYLDADLEVSSTVNSGTITSQLSVPATQLMPFSLMSDAFVTTRIAVVSDQVLEF